MKTNAILYASDEQRRQNAIVWRLDDLAQLCSLCNPDDALQTLANSPIPGACLNSQAGVAARLVGAEHGDAALNSYGVSVYVLLSPLTLLVIVSAIRVLGGEDGDHAVWR